MAEMVGELCALFLHKGFDVRVGRECYSEGNTIQSKHAERNGIASRSKNTTMSHSAIHLHVHICKHTTLQCDSNIMYAVCYGDFKEGFEQWTLQ